MMDSNRRRFLQGLAGASAGLLATGLLGDRALAHVLQTTSPVGNPLRIPATFTGSELVAAETTQAVWPNEPITVWTMGGSYPAPTIRVRTGQQFNVRLRNDLAEPTIVHWHGLVVPHDMDGHPMDVVAAGGTLDYSFPVINRAGTYWYHPHPHMRSAPQVYMGMAGLVIVSDDEEDALDLPTGDHDIPLLVQDRRAAATHTFSYVTSATDRLNGLLGDVLLANGTPDAYLEVDTGLYRFRIVNGSNARILNVGFADGRQFQVIGTDGGLLDKPYPVTTAFVAPAERLEILVDLRGVSVGTSLQLMSVKYGGATDPSQHGYPLPILRLDVVRTGSQGSVPTALRSITPIAASEAARTRIWEMNTRPLAPMEHFHTINGKMFEMERIDGQVKEGEVEIWELQNKHIMPHPIHVHGVQFQVLERINGVEMAPRDYGWKDTVVLWANETVRVIMRFAPYKGVYLIHCHNLEHEDGGMMLNYEIGDVVSAVDEHYTPVPTTLDLR